MYGGGHPVKVYLVPGCTGVYVSWLSNVQHQPLTQLGLAWLGLTGSARLGSARFSSARLGSAYLGLAGSASLAALGLTRLG